MRKLMITNKNIKILEDVAEPIEGTIVNEKDFKELEEFVKESTKHFDSSHNHEHADKVYQTSMEIIETLDESYDDEIITYASKLHDVIDHKYPESIKREELINFITKKIGQDKQIQVMQIIDNISFSKEFNGLREKLKEPLATYLNVISDADRLEAIGKIGVQRCEIYTRSKNPHYTEEEILNNVINI